MQKKPSIPYEDIVQNALRDVVRVVLKQIQREGLPGDHHLFITFLTNFPGVVVPDYLKERHPEEITIVLQYQFWDLLVSEKSFSVELSFNDVAETLVIPFGSIIGFVDPSVKFGLQFTPPDFVDALPDVELAPPKTKAAKAAPRSKLFDAKPTTEDSEDTKVITLDAFRKKK